MNPQLEPHPTEQTLHAYGLGRLDDASAESVNDHLESCPDCRRRVAEVSSDSFLGRLRDAGVQPPAQGPVVSATDGLSLLGGGPVPTEPLPVGDLPPGLADHPDYEVLRELGRGGMGVVYLARNKLMDRLEVLKVVGAHLISKPAVLERFLREIRSAAQLHHPNIVTAYAATRLGESLVLAMEYVEGVDLARRVKEKGPLPIVHACYFVHQAALGLQHAHEHGMVHRDIKPANLILAVERKKAVVKVLDFGLAKVSSEGERDGDRGLTREGQMLGTPDYIAPEQIRNAQKADIRADIYSLGCTLYYLLTGGPPFGGDNLWDLYQAHFSMDASPLNLVRPEVPVELAALAAKMMAKEPARRFQEPKEVVQALIPFFKKGDVVTGAPRAEASRVEQAQTARVEPQTRAAAPTGRPAPDKPPVVPPPIPSPAERAPAVPQWESLINVGGAEHPTKPAPAAMGPQRRRPPWMWPTIVAASVLGALTLGVIVIRIQDDKGREISKIVVPDGSRVLIEHSPNKAEIKPSEPRRDDAAGHSTPVPAPGDGGNPPVSKPTASSTDALALGTSWRGTSTVTYRSWTNEPDKPRALWLTIKERSGHQFTAVAESSRGVHDAEGTFKDGVIEWKVANEVFSWKGKLDGRQLVGNLEGRIRLGDLSGDFRLTLADGPPPRTPPARVPPAGPARVAQLVRGGLWSVEGNNLVKEGPGDGWVAFGDQAWTDYDFTYEVRRSAGSAPFGGSFRAWNGDTYTLSFDDPGDKHCLHRWSGAERRAELIQNLPGTIQSLRWYAVKVSLRGQHIRIELDGQVIFDCWDDFSPRGAVSLRFYDGDSAGRFRNIKVTAPDGTVLWEGPPDLR